MSTSTSGVALPLGMLLAPVLFEVVDVEGEDRWQSACADVGGAVVLAAPSPDARRLVQLSEGTPVRSFEVRGGYHHVVLIREGEPVVGWVTEKQLGCRDDETNSETSGDDSSSSDGSSPGGGLGGGGGGGVRTHSPSAVPPEDAVPMPQGAWPPVVGQLESGEVRFHTLNVGTGACHIIECPDAPPVIYDCGSRGRTPADLSNDEVKAYAERIFDSSPDPPRVFVSHPDSDHVSLLDTLMGERSASEIWLGGELEEYDGVDSVWLAVQYQAGVPIHVGDGVSLGPLEDLACGDATMSIVAANAGTTTNDNSLVLRLVLDDVSILLTGDATGDTQEQALDILEQTDAKTTIITASHHGADTYGSNDGDWASAVTPQVVVYSAGRQYGHPRCSVTEAYRDSLRPSAPHASRCGLDVRHYSDVTSTALAEFMTAVVGGVVIESVGTSYSITCSRDPDCFAAE